jgi:hypothetical protein
MPLSAHFLRQNNVAHRVVNLGVRVVHRATDTGGGACGGAGHAWSAGWLHRERPERVTLWVPGGRLCMQSQAAGAGEGAISGVASGGQLPEIP